MKIFKRRGPSRRSRSRQSIIAGPAAPPIMRPGFDRLTPPSSFQGPWLWNFYSNPTPLQIKQVLELGLQGDFACQWELFRIMQDTWPRLRKSLHELRSAVSRCPWQIIPSAPEGSSPTPEAQRRADFAHASFLTWSPDPGSDELGFEDFVYEMTDALACGLSLQEIVWDQSAQGIAPKAAVWVHPKYYGIDQSGRIGLRLSPSADGGSTSTGLLPLPPDKFIVAKHRTTSGPAGGWGLLRPLAWWWGAAQWGKDWMLNFAQLYGQPIRWVTYDPSTPPATLAILDQMMEQIGSSGWGRFPVGTSLDLKESAKTSGENPQERIQALADRACDILLLGQTLTTDVGDSGSRALGDVHAGVREERLLAVAKWVADVVNYQLLPAFMRLNFGDDDECPIMTIKDTDEPDLDKLATRLETLSRIGVPIPTGWALKRFEIPEAEAGEPILETKAPAAPAFGLGAFGKREEAPEDQPPLKASQDQTAGDGTRFTASSPAATRPRDIPAEIATQKSAALAQMFRGSMAPIRRLVEESVSAADLEARLRAYYADWPAARIAGVMEQALQIMAAAGASEAVQNHAG